MFFTVVLALSAALSYGISDFFGAVGARRLRVLVGTSVTYVFALVALLGFLVIVPGQFSAAAAVSGALAGVAAIIGFLFFYAALSAGPMSLAAPLIAVVGSLVPVAIAVALGERLSLPAWVAVALAFLGAGLISVTRRGAPAGIPRKTVVFALLAGALLGLSIVALDLAPDDSGVSAAFVEIAVGVVLLGVLLLAHRLSSSARRALAILDAEHGHTDLVSVPRARLASAGAGILLGVSNGLLVLALHSGSLAVVSVLIGLYPIGTIVLARLVHHERLAPVQLAGVVVALAASVILSLPGVGGAP